VSGKVKSVFFLLLVISLCSCAKVSVLKKGETLYTGKLWIDLTLKGKKTKRICTYAEFKSCRKFFFLRIKGPFGATLGELFWEKKNSSLLRFYDFVSKKSYFVYLPREFEFPLVKEIPEKNEGKVEMSFFSLKWKIKKRESLIVLSPEKELPPTPDFKLVKVINLISP